MAEQQLPIQRLQNADIPGQEVTVEEQIDTSPLETFIRFDEEEAENEPSTDHLDGLVLKLSNKNSLPPTARQIKNAPPLSAFERHIFNPEERKDHGAIEYVTIPETVEHWVRDPFGERKFDFIAKAYGIPHEQLPHVLKEAGMGEYLQAKSEGRMVGMVSTQVLKPSYYFLSNAFALAELNRKGVPTALMIGEYPQDKFHTANSDKRDAFGKIDFPIGVKTKEVDGQEMQQMQTVQVELRPYGIRHDNGEITRISTIDEANGYRCEQVLVQITDARSPENKSYAKETATDISGSKKKAKTTETYYQGALGLLIPDLVAKRTLVDKKEVAIPGEENIDAISITDFYKALWIETIDRLRQTGDLPSEEEMPMFFIDGLQMYSTIAEYANPSKEILDIMAFSSQERVLKDVLQLSDEEANEILSKGEDAFTEYLASRDLRQLDNGLLVHMNGMMDPGAYYAAQTAWPDMYLECSSCGGDYFVDRLKRSQMVREAYELPESEVKLPDTEIPELEKYVMHPTGRYFDTNQGTNPQLLVLKAEFDAIPQLVKAGTILPEDAKNKKDAILKEMGAINLQQRAMYYTDLQANKRDNYIVGEPHIPDIVAATYKELFANAAEKLEEEDIQQTVVLVREYNGLPTTIM